MLETHEPVQPQVVPPGARYFRKIRLKMVHIFATDKPLWPWPMNDRIKELKGIDVTATIQQLGGQ